MIDFDRKNRDSIGNQKKMKLRTKFFLDRGWSALNKNDMMMKIQTEGQRILVVSFSVLIITHGREDLLMKCLESMRVGAPFELVLFANGMPLSSELATYLKDYPAEVKLAESTLTLSPGEARNRALKLVSGDWVHFIDDDSYWTRSYHEILKPLLQNPNCEVFGGPDSPARPMSYFQESVSLTLSSPFCTGVTSARHRSVGRTLIPATEEILTSCNLWVRRIFLEESPFPEDFKRTEENFFLQKLARNKRRMFYHPLLVVGHFRRKSLSSLFRPTLGAGYWRSRLNRKKLGAGFMFWLPTVFVLLHLSAFFSLSLFMELAKVYLLVVIAVSFGISSRSKKVLHFPMVALLHYVIVFLYGSGFLLERVGYKWK